MSDILRVSIVQANLLWEDVEENLQHFSKMLDRHREPSDLIIFPEMFTSGFTMTGKEKIARYAGETLLWMQKHAKDKKAYLLGSIIIKEGNRFFNRLYAVAPNGQYQHYDKRHLFRMGQEDRHFGYGNQLLTFRIGKWRVRPLICYDLRFPVWSRNRNDYDLLIYIANWPDSRREVWNTLLKARALENMAYVAGVNRIGNDKMHLNYAGDSVVLDARANKLGACHEYQEEVRTISISLSELEAFRAKFPVHKDADSFEILF